MLPRELTPQFLRSLKALTFATRRLSQGRYEGQHRTLRRGHGIEFAEYRHYEPGDNPKHIDWKLLARTDRTYVRTYQEERNLSVLLVLDTTASMMADPIKWERALTVTLGLGYIASLNKERTTLIAPPSLICHNLSGPRTLHYLSESLGNIKSGTQEQMISSFGSISQTLKPPAICFLLSDFLIPNVQAAALLNIFQTKNLDVYPIQILGALDCNPFRVCKKKRGSIRARDSETGEQYLLSYSPAQEEMYSMILQEHILSISRLCTRRRMRHLLLNYDQDLLTFFATTLRATGVLK